MESRLKAVEKYRLRIKTLRVTCLSCGIEFRPADHWPSVVRTMQDLTVLRLTLAHDPADCVCTSSATAALHELCYTS
jgi:hypothetical protein